MPGRAGFCVRVHHAREEAAWTAQLLLQGPEPLQSQFESGYGMALNLLFSRSLSQAKDFIDRSFSAYLSAHVLPASVSPACLLLWGLLCRPAPCTD